MTAASVVPTGSSPGAAKTSGLAVASLVAGILGLCTAGLGGIAGLILGIVALKKIGHSGGALRGRGLAIAGLIVSVCTVLVWMLLGVVALKSRGSDSVAARAPHAVKLSPAVSTAAAPADELTLDLGGGVTMKMVLIRPGKFMMGSPASEPGRSKIESPLHEVTISKPFYMGVTEVTQAQYEAVMGTNPSEFKGPTNPVDSVSWNDATEFCKKLSEKTRQIVRLPTEAEWEYACRAGNESEFSFGDDPSALGDYAWHGRNSGMRSHPVGQKKPNAWGLYDMQGNVWEWCADWDWYTSEASREGPATDPSGPATGELCVWRGGSYDYGPEAFRCAFRYGSRPAHRENHSGFRVVVSVAGASAAAALAPAPAADDGRVGRAVSAKAGRCRFLRRGAKAPSRAPSAIAYTPGNSEVSEWGTRESEVVNRLAPVNQRVREFSSVSVGAL
jgi:formylglycine-generating enzyme required for sulfatase activity